jgi:hypothetical protein
MSKEDVLPPLPTDAPQEGEVYRHYKGDSYRVVGVALHSDETWLVVYEPMYEGAVSKLFTRPVAEWGEPVEWQGQKTPRFTRLS